MLTMLAAAHLSRLAQIELSAQTLSLAELVTDVGRQSGRTISCEGAVGKEILGIAARPVPLEVFLKCISTAVDASFKQTESGYVIYRSAEDEEARRKREESARVEMIRFLVALKPPLRGFGEKEAAALAANFDAQWKRSADPRFQQDASEKLHLLAEETPSVRFARRIWGTLPDRTISRLTPGARIVFATHPTPKQQALPAELQEEFRRFKEEQSQFAAAIGPKLKSKPGPNLDAGLFKSVADDFELRVVLDASLNRGAWHCVVSGVDQKRSPLFTAASTLVPRDLKIDKSDLKGDRTCQLAARTQDVWRAIDDVMNGRPTQAAAEVRESIAREPEPIEPLLGPVLNALREETGQNILVVADDRLYVRLFHLWRNSRPRLSEFDQVLGSGEREKISEAGWRTYRPRLPITESQNTVDRALLTDLLRGAAEDGFISLRTYAKFVLMHPQASQLPLVSMLSKAVVLQGLPIENWNLSPLRAFALLEPPDRGSALRSEDIPEAMREIERFVFSADNPPLSPEILEPTSAFPDGLPAKCTVTVSLSADRSVSRWGPPLKLGFTMEAQTVSPLALAIDFSRNRANLLGGVPEDWRYFPVARKTWTFEVRTGDTHRFKFGVTERRPLSAGLVTFDELPEPFRAEVQLEQKRLKGPIDRSSGVKTGGNPPLR